VNKKTPLTLVIVAADAIPIGIYTILPLIINATVNEPLPATISSTTTTVPGERALSGIIKGD
jgi:hypothetical protein